MPTQSDVSAAYGGANYAPLTDEAEIFSSVRIDLGELNYAFDATAADLPTWQPAFGDHDVKVNLDIAKGAMTDIFLIANNYQYGTAPSSLRWDDETYVKLLFGTTEIGSGLNNVPRLRKFFGEPETGVWSSSNIVDRSTNPGSEVISGEFMAYLSSVILGDASKTDQFRNTAAVTEGIDSSIHARMNKTGLAASSVKTNIMQSVYSGLVANDILLMKDIVIAAIDSASLYDASGTELSAFEAQEAAKNAIVTTASGADATLTISLTVDATMESFDYNNAKLTNDALLRVKALIIAIVAGTNMETVGDMTTAHKVKAYITKCFYAEAMVASHRYETYEKAFRDLVEVQTKTLALVNKNTDIYVSKPLAVAKLTSESSANPLISAMLGQVSLDVASIAINVDTMSTVVELHTAVYKLCRLAGYQNTVGILKCLTAAAPANVALVNTALMADTHYDLGSYDILREGETNNCKVKKMATVNTAGTAPTAVVYASIATTGYASETTVSFAPATLAERFFTDIHYLLHSKLYGLAPERYVSVFDNINDENFLNNDGVAKPFRWNIRGLPFLPGDTISYLITVSPSVSQSYAVSVPKVRKYKIQLTVV